MNMTSFFKTVSMVSFHLYLLSSMIYTPIEKNGMFILVYTIVYSVQNVIFAVLFSTGFKEGIIDLIKVAHSHPKIHVWLDYTTSIPIVLVSLTLGYYYLTFSSAIAIYVLYRFRKDAPILLEPTEG